MQSRMLEAAGVAPGWLAVAAAGVAVIAYFLGCFNGAVVVSRYILRDDIRQHGSGNAGLTNFYRVFGGPLTAVVILSDALKAVLAVLFAVFIAKQISPELVVLAEYWAGAFCMVGHMFPCTFQFRGGKGVLSGSAVAIMIGINGGGVLPSWIVPVTVWVGFIILVAATRYVSLGSCWGGASFIVVSWLVYQDPLILTLATVMGGLLLWGHRGNMVRLVKGTERKFEFHKKNPAPAAEMPAEEPEEKSAPAAVLEKPAGPAPKALAEPAPEISAEPALELSEEASAPEGTGEPAAAPGEEPAEGADAQPESEDPGMAGPEEPIALPEPRPRKHKRKKKS